jgi:two-component system response regulator DesR
VKVLLIDDSNLILERLSSALAETGDSLRVQVCAEVNQALRIAEAERPDMIVFEIHSVAGFSFGDVQAIKEKLPHTIMVMFTHFVLSRYREKAQQAGVDHFFLKSGDFERMVETVKRIVRPRPVKTVDPQPIREIYDQPIICPQHRNVV